MIFKKINFLKTKLKKTPNAVLFIVYSEFLEQKRIDDFDTSHTDDGSTLFSISYCKCSVDQTFDQTNIE